MAGLRLPRKYFDYSMQKALLTLNYQVTSFRRHAEAARE